MSTQTNHTPLDFNNLLNSYGKPKTTPVGGNKVGSRSSSNLPNLFLVLSVFAFVGAFAFSVTQQQATTNTQASAPKIIDIPTKMALAQAKSPFRSFTQYPKSFKGKQISLSLYQEGETKYADVTDKALVKTYLIDQISRYYVYKDALEENGIFTTPQNDAQTFEDLESDVEEYEKMVRDNLVSNIDFGYIMASYDKLQNQEEAVTKFGPDLQVKADEVVNTYRTELQNLDNDPLTILTNAQTDPTVMILTGHDQNKIYTNYIRDDDFILIKNIPSDSGFNDFLFSAVEKEPSEVYELGDQSKYAYIFVYPFKIEVNKYDYLKDIFAEKQSLFSL